ncbi:MAG: response regulator [Elusimicrobia bacterium]|nr:response regulator [Elusimicrobiota bacterium]
MNILLVDDDEATLVTMGMFLSQRGCKVKTASGGVEALKLLRAASFDWLIVDGNMTPINGLIVSGIAQEIRPDMKIVMISGTFQERDIAGTPILKLFTKPVDVEALLAYLRLPAPRPHLL